MVYKPTNTLWCYSQIICGTTMIIISSVVMWKLRASSNNKFAYVLMLFTAMLGVANLGMGLTKTFRREEELPNGTHYFVYFYVNQPFLYLMMAAAL